MKKKIITTISIFIVLLILIRVGVPALKIKKENLTAVNASLYQTGDKIPNDGYEQVVAVSEHMKLYIDPSTLKVRLMNTANGTEWRSYVSGSDKSSELALLSISYLGEDNNLYEWDTDAYCAQIGSYELEQLENGVKIRMDVNEGESQRFYEYLPKKMSIEEYEKLFLQGINDACTNGEIDEETRDRYLTTISLVYKKSIMEECYAVTYTGNPPVSATKQMIAIANLVGYTNEMLLADAEAFEFRVVATEVAEFLLSMYITLEDDSLVVSIPTNEIESKNDYFTLQNIKVMPNFGAVTATQMENGYLFVPDGCGALMQMNSYQAGIPDYVRPVYDHDFLRDYYYMPEYGEELMMPVYGMLYGDLDSSKQGFLAVIDAGAESSYIHTMLAGDGTDGALYNKIYSSFDTCQYSKVKVYGAYSEEPASYLVKTDVMDMNYSLRYFFFGKKATYYDFASTYKEYLAALNQTEPVYRDGNGYLYLDALGSLTVKERILGIPYDKTLSMTEYTELEGILQDLQGIPMTVSYEGIFNGGMNNEVNNTCKLESKNGSKKELKSLQKYAEDHDIDLYYQVALSRVYDQSGNGYRSSVHSVKDYANDPATIYRYDPSTGILNGYFDRYANFYEMVSPQYLNSVTTGFLKKSKDFSKLYISDLANLAYGDYDNTQMITSNLASKVVENCMELLTENKEVILNDPFMKYIGYTDLAVGVSRENSHFATFAHTVPFRQLVMNGLADYTTKDINMSSLSKKYYVLQAVELGSIPKFTITSHSEDVLKNTDYDYLYAIQYDKLAEDVKAVYKECETAWSRIGTNEIIDHSILAENVFQTSYANGVKTIVNYNQYAVSLEDGTTLDALGYSIIGEEE